MFCTQSLILTLISWQIHVNHLQDISREDRPLTQCPLVDSFAKGTYGGSCQLPTPEDHWQTFQGGAEDE